MKIIERIPFLLEALRRNGLKDALQAGWSGLTNLGSTRLILVGLSEPRPLPKALEAAKDHTFKFATIEDLTELTKDPGNNIAATDIERVKKGTARCLLQMDEDSLAGYAWIWVNKLSYIADGYHLNLPDDTI